MYYGLYPDSDAAVHDAVAGEKRLYIMSIMLVIFTQRRSVAKSVGCFQRRLFVCVFVYVCVFVCLSTR